MREPKAAFTGGKKFLDERGQIEGFDIIVSVFIFLGLLAFATYFWQDIFFVGEKHRQVERLWGKAIAVSDQLVLTPGLPSNWNSLADYNKIGLAGAPRKLSQPKLSAFQNADYNSAKQKLNIQGHEYWVVVLQEGNKVFEKGTSRQKEKGIAVERSVLYNNKESLFRIVLYE